MSQRAIARLNQELIKLNKNQIPGIYAHPINDSDITKWKGRVEGAKGTPFEGGYFHFKIDFPENYPFEPPKIIMKTKVYHPNINYETGSICVNILKKDKWVATNNISSVLLSLQGLLTNPNTNDPLVGEINDVYVNEPEKYEETVREWVKLYASNPDYKE